MEEIKCPVCDGGGEVQGFSLRYDDDGTTACPCCKGEGMVLRATYDQYLREEELAAKQEAIMEDMANMQEFEDRISPPLMDEGE